MITAYVNMDGEFFHPSSFFHFFNSSFIRPKQLLKTGRAREAHPTFLHRFTHKSWNIADLMFSVKATSSPAVLINTT